MTTQETRRVEEDLTYIRGAVERMERGPYQSVTIAAIWAVIVAVGFSINDFRPEISMVYWSVAAIGRLSDLPGGSRDRAEPWLEWRRRRSALHLGVRRWLLARAFISTADSCFPAPFSSSARQQSTISSPTPGRSWGWQQVPLSSSAPGG